MVPRYHGHMSSKLLPLAVHLHHTEQDEGECLYFGGSTFLDTYPFFSRAFTVRSFCSSCTSNIEGIVRPYVKVFGLLQPYFGHLGCMPVVCMTHYKTSKECFLFVSKLECSWEASLSIRIFLQKAYSYLVTLLAFLAQPCNQGTPPGADV